MAENAEMCEMSPGGLGEYKNVSLARTPPSSSELEGERRVGLLGVSDSSTDGIRWRINFDVSLLKSALGKTERISLPIFPRVDSTFFKSALLLMLYPSFLALLSLLSDGLRSRFVKVAWFPFAFRSRNGRGESVLL